MDARFVLAELKSMLQRWAEDPAVSAWSAFAPKRTIAIVVLH